MVKTRFTKDLVPSLSGSFQPLGQMESGAVSGATMVAVPEAAVAAGQL